MVKVYVPFGSSVAAGLVPLNPAGHDAPSVAAAPENGQVSPPAAAAALPAEGVVAVVVVAAAAAAPPWSPPQTGYLRGRNKSEETKGASF